jgi:hypothetical protein
MIMEMISVINKYIHVFNNTVDTSYRKLTKFILVYQNVWVTIIIIIKFLYLSACKRRVAYNRQALKLYIIKSKLRLVLKLELELD